jgi:hypothetical protein
LEDAATEIRQDQKAQLENLLGVPGFSRTEVNDKREMADDANRIIKWALMQGPRKKTTSYEQMTHTG